VYLMNITAIDIAQQTHIGSDETLKGDTFGGIVVCACYTDQTENFSAIGVKDSKLLTNEHIMRIGAILLEQYPDNFSFIAFEPKEYNELLSFQNQTHLLNTTHKKVASLLQERFGHIPHFVDEFPGCTVGDVAETKAESISLAVAAASIVARYKGLLQFETLSNRAGFKLPMGSTHVKEGLAEALRRGLVLSEFAKLHFKNVQLAQKEASSPQKTLSEGF